jgi:hypothetical protein
MMRARRPSKTTLTNPSLSLRTQGIDPYVRLECAGTKAVASRTIFSNRNPKWNQQLSLNIQVPVQRGISPVVKVCVYDKDVLGGDDLVATLPFNLRDVVLDPEHFNKPMWRPMYGAPPALERGMSLPGEHTTPPLSVTRGCPPSLA